MSSSIKSDCQGRQCISLEEVKGKVLTGIRHHEYSKRTVLEFSDRKFLLLINNLDYPEVIDDEFVDATDAWNMNLIAPHEFSKWRAEELKSAEEEELQRRYNLYLKLRKEFEHLETQSEE